MVRMADKVSIYNVLGTIAAQCEVIGEKMKEGQPARYEYCMVSIGSRRWDGKRMLNLVIQAPNNNAASGWDRYQIIDLELSRGKYKLRCYTHNRKQINNTFNNRQFADIFKIPMSTFEDLKEVIAYE